MTCVLTAYVSMHFTRKPGERRRGQCQATPFTRSRVQRTKKFDLSPAQSHALSGKRKLCTQNPGAVSTTFWIRNSLQTERHGK